MIMFLCPKWVLIKWHITHIVSPGFFAGLERDKFDNKTVSFEEHIKSEHNMWHYLYFLVLASHYSKQSAVLIH